MQTGEKMQADVPPSRQTCCVRDRLKHPDKNIPHTVMLLFSIISQISHNVNDFLEIFHNGIEDSIYIFVHLIVSHLRFF